MHPRHWQYCRANVYLGLLLLLAHLVLRLLQLGAQRVDRDLEIGLRRGQRLLGRFARGLGARQPLGAVGGRGRLRARGGQLLFEALLEAAERQLLIVKLALQCGELSASERWVSVWKCAVRRIIETVMKTLNSAHGVARTRSESVAFRVETQS